mgnify:CR=1 FL=1
MAKRNYEQIALCVLTSPQPKGGGRKGRGFLQYLDALPEET